MRRPLSCPRALGLFLLAASLLAALPARAQALAARAPKPASVTVTAVDASAFPDMQAYAVVNDGAGQHIAGLTATNFKLTEDGQPIAALQTGEADVGVQVVFALDSSAAFKTRDGNGITRLAYLQQALTDFAKTKPWMRSGVDDVTIIAAEAPVIEHSGDSSLIAGALASYQSTFAGEADPFTLVNSALDFVSDATRQSGMRRFVVFISGGFSKPDVQAQVTDAAARAASVGVPIETVYVGPLGAGNTTPAQNLKKLADATGGQALILETPQSLDPIFQMLSDQGRQYRLSYRSGLSTTGQNKLSLAVSLPDGSSLASNEAVFPLRVEAPQVTLGSLPPSLVRVAGQSDAAPADAEPRAFAVPITIDFPDGHPRSLKLVQLLADGQVVASQANTSSVASLVWPLGPYATSASHRLQARVIDELGLAGESAEASVAVSLQVPAAPPPIPAPVAAVANASWLQLALGLAVLVAVVGVGGGVWMVLARRRAPAPAAANTRPRARVATRALPGTGPLKSPDLDSTLPMAPAGGPNGHGAGPRMTGRRLLPHVSGLHWPGRSGHDGRRGAAFLKVVEPGAGGAPRSNIELLADSLVLGRDAELAETVFADRSVSRRHARIVVENGSYHIFDCGSTSGTWVNYAAIPPDTGHELQDGDLINLGRVQLRFQRRDQRPAAAKAARVSVVGRAPAAGHPVQPPSPAPSPAEPPRQDGL